MLLRWRYLEEVLELGADHALLQCLRLRFLYDGARIGDDDTPASLDMEDNGMSSFLCVSSRTSLIFDTCRYDRCHGRTYVQPYSVLKVLVN